MSSTTQGNAKGILVTDPHGNKFLMIPVDTQARKAIDEAVTLQFDENHFTVTEDGNESTVGLRDMGLEVDQETPLTANVTNDTLKIGADTVFSSAIAVPYTNKTYSVGDTVTYKGHIYECTVAITSTPSAFDPSKWNEITILPEHNYTMPEEITEVVEEVQEMFEDLDTKLTTNIDMANILNHYDTWSSINKSGTASMLLQAFTVPINTAIRLTTQDTPGTLLSVISYNNYGIDVILGLYEYSFGDGTPGSDYITYICDTGIVRLTKGKCEFPIVNLNQNLEAPELRSDKVYYTALYIRNDQESNLRLFGAPGCDTSEDISSPRLGINLTNLGVVNTLSGIRVNPGDTQNNTAPRFFMMIRNGTQSEGPGTVDPFTYIDSYSLVLPTSQDIQTYSSLLNGQSPSVTPTDVAYYGWQKVVPAVDVNIKGWATWSPNQANDNSGAEWADVNKMMFKDNDINTGNPEISVNSLTKTVTALTSLPLYEHKVMLNSGTHTLLANHAYWFPLCGTYDTSGNTKLVHFASTSPTIPNRDVIISNNKWYVGTGNYVTISQALKPYLRLIIDNEGTEEEHIV